MATELERIQRLEERKKTIDAQLREAKNRAKKKARAEDTRRKILLGALMLEEMDRDEAFAERVRAKLNRYLTREVDRELFGLPPRLAAEKQKAPLNNAPTAH